MVNFLSTVLVQYISDTCKTVMRMSCSYVFLVVWFNGENQKIIITFMVKELKM